MGLSIGPVAFIISSEDEGSSDRPCLALLAAGFGAAFAAVILQVADPELLACEAVKHGATVAPAFGYEGVTIIIDPFGSHWALVKTQPARSPK